MRVFFAGMLSAVLSAAAFGQVPFERIVNADKEPGNWLTYSRDLLGHRYSPLNEITTENVGALKVKWALQLPNERSEVSPIVVDNVMYVTGPNWAAALDVHTGRRLWSWNRAIPEDYHNIGFGRVSRGPAVLDDKLYVATLDCYLVALDLKSGAERWSSKGRGLQAGIQHDSGSAGDRGKDCCGSERRGSGDSRIRGCVQR